MSERSCVAGLHVAALGKVKDRSHEPFRLISDRGRVFHRNKLAALSITSARDSKPRIFTMATVQAARRGAASASAAATEASILTFNYGRGERA